MGKVQFAACQNVCADKHYAKHDKFIRLKRERKNML